MSVLPHASPRDGWRHSWCHDDCPLHSKFAVGERRLTVLQDHLLVVIGPQIGPEQRVAAMAVREVGDAARYVLRRFA